LDGGGRMSGKGSKPRPLSVSYDTYSGNFDSIFRKRVVKITTLPDGDGFVELPNDVLKKLDWKEGTNLKLTCNDSIKLTKNEKD
jgi:hypothetical protein